MRNWVISVGSVLTAIIVFAFLYIFINQVMQPKLSSYPLLNLSGAEAADVLSGHVRPGAVEGWNDKAVFVRGSKEDHETVAALLQREDKPTPQVALRFQLIEADGFTTTDESIANVVGVLRGLFKFQGYRLVSDAFMLAKEKSATRQRLVGADGGQYMLEVNILDVTRREGKASAEITTQLSADPFGEFLSTSVNVPGGQTVVLGTARPDSKRGALILVVTPEIK